jgi:Site-specific recombinase XerC
MRCPYLWPIIELALETAMRKGEILSVKWEHVYWNKRMLYLPDSKNGEDRWIPLTASALTVCEQLPKTGTYLFTTSSNAVRLSWDRLIAKAKIQGLRFHDLRHEAISRMVEKGLSVFQVSLITGHKNMAMVRRYAHLKPPEKPSLIGHK